MEWGKLTLKWEWAFLILASFCWGGWFTAAGQTGLKPTLQGQREKLWLTSLSMACFPVIPAHLILIHFPLSCTSAGGGAGNWLLPKGAMWWMPLYARFSTNQEACWKSPLSSQATRDGAARMSFKVSCFSFWLPEMRNLLKVWEIWNKFLGHYSLLLLLFVSETRGIIWTSELRNSIILAKMGWNRGCLRHKGAIRMTLKVQEALLFSRTGSSIKFAKGSWRKGWEVSK